ncbi:MAG: hypothetical protein ACI4JX_06045 [Oscillospiraceae bacterium]
MPKVFRKTVLLISKLTLEIYLVQYAIIPRVNILFFPINWIIITATIAVSAVVLNFVTEKIISLFSIRKIVKK